MGSTCCKRIAGVATVDDAPLISETKDNEGVAVEEMLELVRELREQANLAEVFDSQPSTEMACCSAHFS